MLKNSSLRRITIASIALLIVGIIYLFPKSSEKIPQKINYIDAVLSPIYLIDSNNYVARTEMIIDEDDELLKAKEILEALTIGSNKTDYIPDGFKQIIPLNTRLLDASLEGGLLKINFSKEFNNITEKNESKMLESIVYSLTEIEGINKIMIFVEGVHLNKMPISQKRLPETLDRSFGINKIYNLDTFSDVTMTTIYYLGKYNDNYYYIPVTLVDNNDINKVEIVINNLKSSPIYQANLMSYLASSVELLDFEIKENVASLNFNNYLFSDINSKTILEEVKYSIFLSLKDNNDIQEVIFLKKKKKIENFKI